MNTVYTWNAKRKIWRKDSWFSTIKRWFRGEKFLANSYLIYGVGIFGSALSAECIKWIYDNEKRLLD